MNQEKLFTEALSTHSNLSKENVKKGVDYLLSLKIPDAIARKLSLAMDYRNRTGNYAFIFNQYVDRAITKPAFERLRAIVAMDFKDIFQEFKDPKITESEKASILKIAEEEYNGKTMTIPLIEYCDIGEDQTVYRVYVTSFKALMIGIAAGINPVTKQPFNKEVRNNLLSRYNLPFKMITIAL